MRMKDSKIGDKIGVRIKENYSFNFLFFTQSLQKVLLKKWYILY